MKVLSVQVPVGMQPFTIRSRVINTDERNMIMRHYKIDNPSFGALLDWVQENMNKEGTEYITINVDGLGAGFYDMLESKFPGKVFPA